jgi:mobilome CxxCx(11)CxxC protein
MITVKDCRDKEFYAYGTTRIFERRARHLRSLRTLITFLGIVAPVLVGGLVLTFGVAEKSLPYFITAAGLVGLVQLFLSTWAIVARWDEQYEYSIESSRHNTDLYNKFKSLADANPTDIAEKFEKIQEENQEREFKDIAQNIVDKEKRYAYRESLKYYQNPCHICNIKPTSSKPTKCDGCGNF